MSIDCYCDFDPPTVSSARTVTARKPHRCEECERTIAVGERYRYRFMVYDGYPQSTYTCSHCHEIEQWVSTNLPCFCWYSGSMLDDAKEAIEEAYRRARDEVQGLAFGFGRLLVKAKRARARL